MAGGRGGGTERQKQDTSLEDVVAVQVTVMGLGQSVSGGGGWKWVLDSECILRIELTRFYLALLQGFCSSD